MFQPLGGAGFHPSTMFRLASRLALAILAIAMAAMVFHATSEDKAQKKKNIEKCSKARNHGNLMEIQWKRNMIQTTIWCMGLP